MELPFPDRGQPRRPWHPEGSRGSCGGGSVRLSGDRPGEPSPPEPSWPRYSSRSFPPCRFVPGLNPRPRHDPERAGARALDPWSPEDWWRLEPYLAGVDLYNFAYWWEAHEILEALWHAAGRTSPHACFVQGIIHLSAANLNVHRGKPTAGRRQAQRGIERLRRQGGRVYMGIDVDEFTTRVAEFASGRVTRPALIELIFGAAG